MLTDAHTQRLELPAADDLHVHLRQGELCRSVTPRVPSGGVGRCLVMPNTVPPVDSVGAAIAYRDSLRELAPGVEFFLSLYLSPELREDEVARAGADPSLLAVKCYPRGVTTNSDAGVEDLRAYAHLFERMQDVGLVLQLHGEVPANPAMGVTVLNSEARFLPVVEQLHRAFPGLRIVLEHVSTAEAVALVESSGDWLAATVTPQHLWMTVDDWAGRNHHFCKPVAKTPEDRDAIRRVVACGHPRFFLGSDSAPHPRSSKECAVARAGVFSTPLLMAYMADIFDEMGCLSQLCDFACSFGARFYNLPEPGGRVILERRPLTVPPEFDDIVPFRAGDKIQWTVESVDLYE